MFWTKKMFSSVGDVVVDVRDVAAAQRWYSEKLGLSYSSAEVEEASLELGYSADWAPRFWCYRFVASD